MSEEKKSNGGEIDRVKDRLHYIFRSCSDCYAQTEEGSTDYQAMSEEAFVDVVSDMLAERMKGAKDEG